MTTPGAAILHADLDAFYAAVEQRDRPELQGRPVVVGGLPGGRGVVAAASYEARKFGVHSAMPLGAAQRLCPDAAFVPGRHDVYGEVSKQIMDIIRSITPLVEPLSMDEAFLDVAGCERGQGNPLEIARKIKNLVREKERLTISIGIACNKSVAKIASELSKPDGLLLVERGTERAFLAPLPVNTLWGVGPKTLERLRAAGIATIGDLAEQDADELSHSFGRQGLHFSRLSRGIDPRPVTPSHVRKSLGNEMTFERDVDDPEALRVFILALSEKVAKRLRAEGLRGRVVTLKLRHSDFTTITRRRTLKAHVDGGKPIFEAAMDLFRNAFTNRDSYRLAGVHVSQFAPKDVEQLTLELGSEDRNRRLDVAVDGITDRFGTQSVVLGSLVADQSDSAAVGEK